MLPSERGLAADEPGGDAARGLGKAGDTAPLPSRFRDVGETRVGADSDARFRPFNAVEALYALEVHDLGGGTRAVCAF